MYCWVPFTVWKVISVTLFWSTSVLDATLWVVCNACVSAPMHTCVRIQIEILLPNDSSASTDMAVPAPAPTLRHHSILWDLTRISWCSLMDKSAMHSTVSGRTHMDPFFRLIDTLPSPAPRTPADMASSAVTRRIANSMPGPAESLASLKFSLREPLGSQRLRRAEGSTSLLRPCQGRGPRARCPDGLTAASPGCRLVASGLCTAPGRPRARWGSLSRRAASASGCTAGQRRFPRSLLGWCRTSLACEGDTRQGWEPRPVGPTGKQTYTLRYRGQTSVSQMGGAWGWVEKRGRD